MSFTYFIFCLLLWFNVLCWLLIEDLKLEEVLLFNIIFLFFIDEGIELREVRGFFFSN